MTAWGSKSMTLVMVAGLAAAFADLGCASLSEGSGSLDTDADDDANDDQDDDGSTGPGSITQSSTFTTTGPDDQTGSTTNDPSTTTPSTSGPTTSTATTDATTVGPTDSTTTGPDAPQGYGDCANMGEAVCLGDEACLAVFGFAACGREGCDSAEDCPAAPPGGNAPVTCSDILNGRAENECHLSCADGQTCPTGMTCVGGSCVWPVAALACVDRFAQSVPLRENAANAGMGNDLVPDCTGFDDEEYVVAFRAPATDRYVFDTDGSQLNTVLTLYANDCDGAALGCSNNIGGGNTDSLISLELTQGQVVLAAVDGNGTGSATLNIREQGYGNCLVAAKACRSYEACVTDGQVFPSRAVCSELDCNAPENCMAGRPPGGTAIVGCFGFQGGVTGCGLNCANGRTCPTGMTCGGGLCAWE